MLEKTPRSLEELVHRLLVETNGQELSTVGLLCNSIRTLEYTIERVLQELQMKNIVSKRWNEETGQLVYTYTPPKEENKKGWVWEYDYDETTATTTESTKSEEPD